MTDYIRGPFFYYEARPVKLRSGLGWYSDGHNKHTMELTMPAIEPQLSPKLKQLLVDLFDVHLQLCGWNMIKQVLSESAETVYAPPLMVDVHTRHLVSTIGKAAATINRAERILADPGLTGRMHPSVVVTFSMLHGSAKSALLELQQLKDSHAALLKRVSAGEEQPYYVPPAKPQTD